MSRTIPRIDQRLTDQQLADLRRDIDDAEADRTAGRPYPTQAELAARYGVSRPFVSLVKHGKRRAPKTQEDAA